MGLHSQSSQRVLRELAEAFTGWDNSDDGHNSPGYRKHGDDHPRSTVTWKNEPLSTMTNTANSDSRKASTSKSLDQTSSSRSTKPAPDVEVENIQQVRAVWNGDEWKLHLVYKEEILVEDALGENTAGIDLGISNYLAIDYEDGPSELYPGNVLKEGKHYYTRDEYQTDGENGPSKLALTARQKLSRRKDHFLHTLSKHIVQRCVEEGVAKIAVGDLSDIREDNNSDSRNWGASGNKKLHGWEFDRFARLLEYKAEEHGILVDRVDEQNTSKTCSCCGQIRDSNRMERGLYVCKSCETTMNADVNGAVNIRGKITQSPPTGDMSTGWLAQSGFFLFDREGGSFKTREQGRLQTIISHRSGFLRL